jgi:hypothetical protein
MHNRTTGALAGSLAGISYLALGSAGCGTSTTTATTADTAYEDSYATAYNYSAGVAYAGVYAGGAVGYGIYLATPGGAVSSAKTDGGPGRSVDGGVTVGSGPRQAVDQAISTLANGGTICPGQATMTTQTGTPACATLGTTSARTGLNIVFRGCQLPGGGTVDGTVDVKLTRSASDTTCNAATTITLGYTETLTNLTYTGTGGAKLVIPNDMSTATLNFPLATTPATVTIASNGELQIIAADGTTSSDRTFNGSQIFSSISTTDQSYTVGGMLTVNDKSTNATTTMTGTALAHTTSCCRPTGGTLSVNRTGGAAPGQHTWTFTSTCGSAMLDGKAVTLPDCL